MKIKRAILAPLLVSVFALATGGWLLQRGVGREGNVYTQARLFEEVLHHISERYVDSKDPSSLYKMAIQGLLHELGDPHTAFMTPDEYNALRVQTQGEYGGIGSEIDVRDGWITVVAPLPNSPAERAGLQPGDQIAEIDGVVTRGWSSDEAVSKLRGPKGSAVQIRVRRTGVGDLIPFRLVRDEIRIESVRAKQLMENGIGYIELRVFSENTTGELRKAIDEMRGRGLRGLIIDVRGNPGGLLDQAISSSDLFLKRGQPIAELRGRGAGMSQKFVASDDDRYPGLPVVVLTGPSTASASEILAGALQDHDRALVVGRTSYGKGSVQTLYKLPADHWLKITTARWYTPVGRSIQRPHDPSTDSLAALEGEELETELETSARRLEAFRTDGGRTVFGGGGITPDLIVEPEKLTDQELAFARSLQKYGSKYRDVLYQYALQYGKAHADLKQGFAVGRDLLDGFYQELTRAGIAVDGSLYQAASRWVGQNLAYEITYAKWGPQAARMYLNREDAQVRVASELLREASNPESLFAAASRYAARHGGAPGEKSAGPKAPAGGEQP